jgi:HAD superfamily hydrolase (TIGR01509 family)
LVQPFQKLVIFDCDGVLVDSEQISIKALVMCVNELGIVRSESDFDSRTYKGAKLTVILNAIERETSSKLPVDFERKYRKKMDELFCSELKAIDGVVQALSQIIYPVCVASSGPIEKIKRSLQLTGLAHKFADNLFSSYEIKSWKPEPGIFLHAAEKMGVDPKDCIVVEDALLGIDAAISAGMKSLAFVPEGDCSEYIERGAIAFHRMIELPELLNKVLTGN